MQIKPENPGLAQAGLPAAQTQTPVAGLSKPDLAALVENLNAADAVTLLDVAASDLPRLAQILQTGESLLPRIAPALATPQIAPANQAGAMNPPLPPNQLSPIYPPEPLDQPVLVSPMRIVNPPGPVDSQPASANEQPATANQLAPSAGNPAQSLITSSSANQPASAHPTGQLGPLEPIDQSALKANSPALRVPPPTVANQLVPASQPLPTNQSSLPNRPQLFNPPALADPTVADPPQSHTVTLSARFEAQVKLSQAEQSIEQSSSRKLPDWETDPQTLLQIGHRLYSAGGYGNYLRAAAVADAIQSAYWGATLIHDQTSPSANRTSLIGRDGQTHSPAFPTLAFSKLTARLRDFWHRAPLLVLLLSWLAIGIVGGILFKSFGFEFWALGFLALVGFGFYSTIRR